MKFHAPHFTRYTDLRFDEWGGCPFRDSLCKIPTHPVFLFWFRSLIFEQIGILPSGYKFGTRLQLQRIAPTSAPSPAPTPYPAPALHHPEGVDAPRLLCAGSTKSNTHNFKGFTDSLDVLLGGSGSMQNIPYQPELLLFVLYQMFFHMKFGSRPLRVWHPGRHPCRGLTP